jgi:hypothetical protein
MRNAATSAAEDDHPFTGYNYSDELIHMPLIAL